MNIAVDSGSVSASTMSELAWKGAIRVTMDMSSEGLSEPDSKEG
jgi:hypothetical protein